MIMLLCLPVFSAPYRASFNFREGFLMAIERKKYCVNGEWRESKTEKFMQTVQDPRTSRMNAVLYLLDVDEEKKQQLISQRLTYIQYEKVALIDGYTGQLEFRNSDRKGHVPAGRPASAGESPP